MKKAFTLAAGNGRNSMNAGTLDSPPGPWVERTSSAPYHIEDPQSSSVEDRSLAAGTGQRRALAQVHLPSRCTSSRIVDRSPMVH